MVSSCFADKVDTWNELIRLYPDFNDPILVKYGHHVMLQNDREMEGLRFWMKISRWNFHEDLWDMGFAMMRSIDHVNNKALSVYLNLTGNKINIFQFIYVPQSYGMKVMQVFCFV